MAIHLQANGGTVNLQANNGAVNLQTPTTSQQIIVEQTYNPESPNAQSGKAVAQAIATIQPEESPAANTAYKKLFERVEITADDIAAAGDEGITVITVGSDDMNFAPYSDIVLRIYIPADKTLNSGDFALRISATTYANESIAPDGNKFLYPQSGTTAPNSYIKSSTSNNFSIRGVWCDDTFLYGQSMKNGYGGSYGYAGGAECWNSISVAFLKSKKRYFHITSIKNANGSFKFPVGTYVDVYGR